MAFEAGNIINGLIALIGASIWYQMRGIKEGVREIKEELDETRRAVMHHQHVECGDGMPGVVIE